MADRISDPILCATRNPPRTAHLFDLHSPKLGHAVGLEQAILCACKREAESLLPPLHPKGLKGEEGRIAVVPVAHFLPVVVAYHACMKEVTRRAALGCV